MKFESSIPAFRVFDPAWSIVQKFGGAPKVAELCGVHQSSVVRWYYGPERNGCSGLVPAVKARDLYLYAQRHGIDFDAAEFFAPARVVVFDQKEEAA